MSASVTAGESQESQRGDRGGHSENGWYGVSLNTYNTFYQVRNGGTPRVV